jgi:hypothetical protein
MKKPLLLAITTLALALMLYGFACLYQTFSAMEDLGPYDIVERLRTQSALQAHLTKTQANPTDPNITTLISQYKSLYGGPLPWMTRITSTQLPAHLHQLQRKMDYDFNRLLKLRISQLKSQKIDTLQQQKWLMIMLATGLILTALVCICVLI